MSPRRVRSLAAALAALAVAAFPPAAANAQEPVPRDTLGPEIEVEIPDEAVRADTLPQAGRPESVAADSLVPAPEFPLFPGRRDDGFGVASWVFGPRELGRFHALTLLELLDRIPGIAIVREGDAGRPAGVAPFGAGGGRLRVFVDGWEHRGLIAAAAELQHIPLVDVEEIRVTRDLSEIRVDVRTLRLDDARPFARIEGGEGDFGAQLLRGVFARPFGASLMFHLGVDIVETGGFRRASPFSGNTVFGRVGWRLAEDRGLQLDYRTTSIDTERTLAGGPVPRASFDRAEVILRGRARLGPALWIDGALGRTTIDPQEADTVTRAVRSVQGMLRAAVDVPLGTVTVTGRVHRGDRDGFGDDALELAARADLLPVAGLAAGGEVRMLGVGDARGVEAEAFTRAGPWRGITLFGGISAGSRGIPFRVDTVLRLPTLAGAVDPDAPPFVDVPAVLFPSETASLTALRAGAEIARGSAVLGAAFVAQDVARWYPFGFPYERGLRPVDGGSVGGVEAHLSIPIVWRQLRFDAHYTDFLATPARPRLPARFGRAALEYHGIFRRGAFEPTLRVEVIARDAATSIDPATGAAGAPTVPYAFFNFFIQIRVLDVRAFWRMENLANRTTAVDVPGHPLPGNRAMFGVRWFFRD